MKLRHITFTGIDGKTDLGALWELQKQYPIAEFGVLIFVVALLGQQYVATLSHSVIGQGQPLK